MEERYPLWLTIGGTLFAFGAGTIVLVFTGSAPAGTGSPFFWPAVVAAVLGAVTFAAPFLGLPLPRTRTRPFWKRSNAMPDSAPKLDLTFEAGKSPYFEVDETTMWDLGRQDDYGQPRTTSSARRWFRVGVKNHSTQTVEDVRVELASIDPPTIGHLPLMLSIMHGTPQPLIVHPATEPTYFADVVLKLDKQVEMHIMSAVPTPRTQGGIPPGRYRLGIRVTGRDTPAVTKHYIAAVDNQNRLTFAQTESAQRDDPTT